MKKVTFYLVRHGETLFNTQNKMQGWCDSPLTEKGIRDAYTAKDILKEVPLNRAFTSTSERCRDTADIILEGRNIPRSEMKGLKEINFGIYEGADNEAHKEEFDHRRKTFNWKDVGGDDYASFEKRIKETYAKIFDECRDGDTVLIVSHGGAFIWMLSMLFNISKEKLLGLRIKKGLSPMPNGYVGRCTCVDGTFHFDQMIGLSAEDLDACLE